MSRKSKALHILQFIYVNGYKHENKCSFPYLYEARFALNKSYLNSSILVLKYTIVLTSRLLLRSSVDTSVTCFLTKDLYSFSIISMPGKVSISLLFLTSSPQYYIQTSRIVRSNISLVRYWVQFCRDFLWSLNVTDFVPPFSKNLSPCQLLQRMCR
jgi:hypothetical protein